MTVLKPSYVMFVDGAYSVFKYIYYSDMFDDNK